MTAGRQREVIMVFYRLIPLVMALAALLSMQVEVKADEASPVENLDSAQPHETNFRTWMTSTEPCAVKLTPSIKLMVYEGRRNRFLIGPIDSVTCKTLRDIGLLGLGAWGYAEGALGYAEDAWRYVKDVVHHDSAAPASK
jgi:hypothetical protein